MSQKLIVERKDEDQESRIVLKGVIDENVDFQKVFSDLKPRVFIDLEGITFINSCGVREWVRAIQEIPENIELSLERCAPRIVEQINYVSNFSGSGKVLSFFAPYFCAKCQKEHNALLLSKNVSPAKAKAPAEKCPKCGNTMDFDDIEEEYFSFLLA